MTIDWKKPIESAKGLPVAVMPGCAVLGNRKVVKGMGSAAITYFVSECGVASSLPEYFDVRNVMTIQAKVAEVIYHNKDDLNYEEAEEIAKLLSRHCYLKEDK